MSVKTTDRDLASRQVKRNGNPLTRKSPAMILAILAAYASAALYFTPRLNNLFGESTSIAGDVALALFIFQLNVFWLYACFFLMQALFSFFTWFRAPPKFPPTRRQARIAILYTTLHDFQESAVQSCMDQDYPQCRTFILDDSRDDDAKAVVDDFASNHPEVTVIRRSDRTGFKAGNINNALRNHIRGYDYFAIADADSLFPKDFVSSLVPYFAADNKLGFLQARFVPAPSPQTAFAADLALQIHAMWGVYCRARNNFGSVIFLGHGGMLRYDLWEQIGGFPEIVSEDLGFSHRAARLGYRGRYVLETASAEEFPETYVAFRKQQKRYVQGITQYLHREYGPYLRCPQVRWFEKLDTLLTCGSLLMPAFFLSFMLLYCVAMPFLFGVRNVMTLEFGNLHIDLPVRLLSQTFYDVAYSPDYFIWTALCTLSPMIGAIPIIARRPFAGLRMLALAAGPYMSLMITSSASIVSYLLFRTAAFTATGDRKAADKFAAPSLLKKVFSADVGVGLCEVSLGGYLIAACIWTLNPMLPAFAVGLCLAPFLSCNCWQAFWFRPLLYLPLLLLAVGITWSTATMLAR